MAIQQYLTTFRTPLNQGFRDIAQQFNTFFAGRTRVNVQSLDYSRLESTSGAGDLHLRVLWTESTLVGLTVQLRHYQTTPAQSAQAAFNAEFGPGVNLVPIQFLDVTDHEKVRGNDDQILVLVAITNRGILLGGNGLVGYERSVFVAEALLPIAPGASGSCLIYDANGVILSQDTPVQNVGAFVMPIFERVLVVYDRSVGGYVTQAICCGLDPIFPAVLPGPGPQPACPTKETVSQDPLIPGVVP